MKLIPYFDFDYTVAECRNRALVSCPPWLSRLDVRPLVSFDGLSTSPRCRSGRPTNDLVETLRTALIFRAFRQAAGSDAALSAAAVELWQQDKETVDRALRSYRSGSRVPSKGKLEALAGRYPEVHVAIDWPWHSLIPRWSQDEAKQRVDCRLGEDWETASGAHSASPEGPDIFWTCIRRFRQALCWGTAQQMVQAAGEVLLSAPHAFTHPLVRPRAIELIDLVFRLLSAMPPPLYQPPIDVTTYYRPFLRQDELEAVPNKLIDRFQWQKNRHILGRYAAHLLERENHEHASAFRQVWDFLPEVKERNNRTTVSNAGLIYSDAQDPGWRSRYPRLQKLIEREHSLSSAQADGR